MKSTIKVTAPNCLHMIPGGQYNLNEDSQVEARVVKLHMLIHHMEMMIEDLCESNENNIKKGKEAEVLADALFKEYRLSIEKGLNVFDERGSAEAGVDPIGYKVRLIVNELKEAKGYCEDAVEASYIRALIQLITYVDVIEYKKLHAKLDDFEKDAGRMLYWKNSTKL